jgi:uncharacterized protein (TIGR01777 family)
MHVLVSGSHGLVGSALVSALTCQQNTVWRLVRSRPAFSGSDVLWDPQAQTLDAAGLEGLDAIVHLAGEPIAAGRWTLQKQTRIHDSRVLATRLLASAVSRLNRPPKVLICASAIGYYGDRSDEWLTEASTAGSGFLPEVCQAWESAAEPAVAKGLRVAWLRFGMILSPHGGALAKMLPIFRAGLGGPLGSGKQFVSWISIDDAVGVIRHALERPDISGPVNATSPAPITNRDFTAALGRVLRRPAVLPAPAFALRLAMGPMADALLLASARVRPQRLQETAYVFQDPEIEKTLRRLTSGAASVSQEPMHWVEAKGG